MMLPDYVGQRDALAPLIPAIEASRATGRPLPHALFLGRPGTGKTALARSVARELGGPFVAVNAATVKDADAISQAALRAEGGILFLDEIHALDRKQAESAFTLLDTATVTVQRAVIGQGWRYEWIENKWDLTGPSVWLGPGMYEVPVPVEARQTRPEEVIVGNVTVIGATTDEALLPPALLSRLSRLVVRLRPYNDVELATIATLYSEEDLGCSLDGQAAILLAQRSRQSPRRVKQLTERASDYALTRRASTGEGAVITVEDAEHALEAAGIDEHGLEAPHRQMLRILTETGGVSRTSLAQRMGLPPKNADLYWSELAERGMVTIGRRHEATDTGKAVLT